MENSRKYFLRIDSVWTWKVVPKGIIGESFGSNYSKTHRRITGRIHKRNIYGFLQKFQGDFLLGALKETMQESLEKCPEETYENLPSEISYWIQDGGPFGEFSLEMPVWNISINSWKKPCKNLQINRLGITWKKKN